MVRFIHYDHLFDFLADSAFDAFGKYVTGNGQAKISFYGWQVGEIKLEL